MSSRDQSDKTLRLSGETTHPTQKEDNTEVHHATQHSSIDATAAGTPVQSNGLQEDQDLCEKIKLCGLELEFWLSILNKDFQITTINQLKNLGTSHLKQLKKYVRQTWEENGLEKLLEHLKHEASAKKNKRENAYKQRDELFNSVTSSTSCKLTESSCKGRLLTAMDSNDDQPVIKKRSTTLKPKLDDLIPPTDVIYQRLEQRDLFDIANASAGQLLRGVYFCRNGKVERKTTVMKASSIKIMGPSQQCKDLRHNFSSKTMKDDFERRFEISNISSGIDCMTSLGPVGAKLNLSWDWDNVIKENAVNNTEEVYESIVKYCTVPVKAIDLKTEDFRLNEVALMTLQIIDKKIDQGYKTSDILSECNRFFVRYGTHVNEGIVHLGGIYKYTATFKSLDKSHKTSASRLTSDAFEAGAKLAACGIGKTIGVALSGKHLKEEGHLDSEGKYSEEDISNVVFELTTIGGPPAANLDLQAWKNGLNNDSSVWAVIPGNSYTGVWNIIRNHSHDFEHQEMLMHMFECAWQLNNLEQSVNDIMQYNEILNTLNETMLKLVSISGDAHFMQHLFETNSNLQKFLNSVPDQELVLSGDSDSFWNSVACAKFPKSTKLSNFIVQRRENMENLPSSLSKQSIESSKQLIDNLSNEFLPQIRIQVCNRKQEAVEKFISREMTLVCKRLLEKFKEKHCWEYLSLTTILSILKYDQDAGFPSLLFVTNIEDFVEKSKTWLHKYEQIGTSSDIRRDVEILSLVLQTIQNKEYGYSSLIFKRCYTATYAHLHDKVKQVIDSFFRRKFSSWDEALTDLDRLIHGDDTVSLPIEKIMDVSSMKPHNREKQSTKNIPEKLANFLANTEIIRILPEKLEFCHVISILPERENRIENIIMYFIKSILEQNSAIYQSVEKFIRDSDIEESRHDNETDDDLDFLNVGTTAEVKSVDVNPLDLIMAVFICSSQSLKETLVYKMHECRLAVPILLPDIECGDFTLDIDILRSITAPAKRGSVLDLPCNLFTFMRIGRPETSKAKLINEFIQKQSHDIFVNNETPLGLTKRLFSDGIIEVAFFTEDSVDTTCCAFNLRGDAIMFSRQTELLTNLTNAAIILISIEKLQDKKTIDIVKKLQDSQVDLVIALEAPITQRDKVKQITSSFNALCSQKPKYVILSMAGIKQRSYGDVTRDIRKNLGKVVSSVPLNTFRIRVEDLNLRTPRSEEEIKAIEACKIVLHNPHLCRKELVPLQMEPLRELCKNEKLLYDPKQYRTSQGREKIRMDINKNKITLLNLVPWIHDFFIQFIGHCVSFTNDSSLVTFVNGIKSNLKLKEKHDVVRHGKSDTTDIIETMFSFEHILREVGQIYDAVIPQASLVDTKTLEMTKSFPLFAAKLFKHGFPFEILNGEIIYVPVNWVKAVIEALIDIIGDRKCLVLSVVGTQSSGKSTLLNTMFGLRFPVGHGRVTKGAFIQLIQVEDRTLPYECIFVIDTEGLRAPELGAENFRRDNGFATFIMGLADITIVNIQGEFSTEINEILQMVVHSLLRLRLSNVKMNATQSCVFIHQSVRSDHADEGLKETMQSVINGLDEMTRESADLLNIANVDRFNDVINFDHTKHTFYLPYLLSGEEPMFYTNRSYSAKAVEIRQKILTEVYATNKKQSEMLTLSNISLLIGDIWTGVIGDDFALQFKNSLEVKAFTLLDRKFQEIVYEVQHDMNMFIIDQRYSLIKCSDDQALENELSKVLETLPEINDNHSKKAHKELDEFIDSSNLKTIMAKYRQTFSSRMDTVIDMEDRTTEPRLRRIINALRDMRRHDNVKQEFMERINFEASQLAKKFKEKEISKEVLDKTFADRWTVWETQYLPTDDPNDKPVDTQIREFVRKRYPSELNLMGFLTDIHGGETMDSITSLRGSITVNDIMTSRENSKMHITIPKSIIGYVPTSPVDQCKAQTVNLTDTLFSEIESVFIKIEKADANFEDQDMGEILKMIDDCIQEKNSYRNEKYHKFKLTSQYKALLLSKVVPYCIQRFEKIKKRYEKAHSLQILLKEYKPTAQKLFIDLVNSKAEDEIAAELFLKEIETCVEDDMDMVIPNQIEKKLLVHFEHSKYELQKQIMKYLAENNDFTDFIFYINSPLSFVQNWLIKFTDSFLFEKQPSQLNRLYDDLCREQIERSISRIREAVKITTNELSGKLGNPTERWIHGFVTRANQSSISEEKLSLLKQRQITDIDNFQQAILNGLEESINKMVRKVNKTTKDSVRWKTCPYTKTYTKLWGCLECCPFCCEPCELSANHESERHRCRQHRPQGIGDFAWNGGTGTLVSEICSNLITSEKEYELQDSNKKYKFRHYRQKFPYWDIPETFQHPKYWTWFFREYNKQLAKLNGVNPAEIPVTWPKCDQKEAIDSL